MRFGQRGLSSLEGAVVRKSGEIPRGGVRRYGWVARESGPPAAVRAVGTALANNPIPYFIPCHRVVRTDGHIGNYGGGGPEAKKAILTLEAYPGRSWRGWARPGTPTQGARRPKSSAFPPAPPPPPPRLTTP